MSSAEYSCKLFKPIFAYRQTMWTQIRLLLWVHTVCRNDFWNHKQMTKQMTIVVIGGLRIKLKLSYNEWSVLTHCRLNELPHTIYWKSPVSILGMSGYVIYIFLEKNGLTICKQWRPWSDAAFCDVWSGSALFANHPFRGFQTTVG